MLHLAMSLFVVGILPPGDVLRGGTLFWFPPESVILDLQF